MNLLGTRVLHYYSTRMVNSIWLQRSGQEIQIEFMNAFFAEKTGDYEVQNFGYLKPSRLYNVDTFSHKQKEDFYINFERNMYHEKDYRDAVRAMCQGKTIYTGEKIDVVYRESVK